MVRRLFICMTVSIHVAFRLNMVWREILVLLHQSDFRVVGSKDSILTLKLEGRMR